MVADLRPDVAGGHEVARLQAENERLREDNARLRARTAELEEAVVTLRRAAVLMKEQHKDEHSDGGPADREDLEGELRRWQVVAGWLDREHGKCAGVQAMLQRVIERMEAALVGRTATDPDVVLVPPEELAPLARKAAEADTLRRNFEYLLAAMVDKRFKPGMRATIAALVDIVGAPVPGSYSPPQRVYRDQIARRTGQSVDTVGDHLQDLTATSTAKVEPRAVLKEREDEDGTKFLRPETELWVSLGPLPDTALSKEQVAALCQRAKADAARKRRCPRCGSTHLVAAAYRCQACGCTCTADEAGEAGATMQERPSGTIADAETGEVMHPGKPGLPFIPAHDRGVDSTPRSDGPRGVEMTPPITVDTGAWNPRPVVDMVPQRNGTRLTVDTGAWIPRLGVSAPIDLHVPAEQRPAAEGGCHDRCSDCRRPIPTPAIGAGRCAPCRQRIYAQLGLEDSP